MFSCGSSQYKGCHISWLTNKTTWLQLTNATERICPWHKSSSVGKTLKIINHCVLLVWFVYVEKHRFLNEAHYSVMLTTKKLNFLPPNIKLHFQPGKHPSKTFSSNCFYLSGLLISRDLLYMDKFGSDQNMAAEHRIYCIYQICVNRGMFLTQDCFTLTNNHKNSSAYLDCM